jgi:hypothetical protein
VGVQHHRPSPHGRAYTVAGLAAGLEASSRHVGERIVDKLHGRPGLLEALQDDWTELDLHVFARRLVPGLASSDARPHAAIWTSSSIDRRDAMSLTRITRSLIIMDG